MPLLLKMIDVFSSLKSLFKIQRISEDTLVFRLHYRTTVALLLGGCVTLACKSISGSPIHCEASGSVDKVVLETFCWLHTTYSMVHAFNLSLGQAVPYPGVANSKGEGIHGHTPHPLVKQHKYYQWVIFFLLLQVIEKLAGPRPLAIGQETSYVTTTGIRIYIRVFDPIGDSLLHSAMAVEGLGGWEDSRSHDGSRHRFMFGSRKETKEEDAARLPMGKSSLSQLVGIQVLPLRSSRSAECDRVFPARCEMERRTGSPYNDDGNVAWRYRSSDKGGLSCKKVEPSDSTKELCSGM
uniref:Innexin n=1 Tax=Vespula pensylvanica TaxID=30213 RepID=A0A834UBJ6_VESPE|nr:hypothetical protein H0235_007423 [Vespula pensylvanica]